MPAKEVSRSTRSRRQRKRRRTDPDDISSPSSTSSSSSSSSEEETRITSRPQAKVAANGDSERPTSFKDETKLSLGKTEHTRREKRKRENVPLQRENSTTTALQQPSPPPKLAPTDSASASESESEGESEGDASSSPASSESSASASQTLPRQPDIDTQFETWYLRAVTSQYGNDLDKLRTEAADFKSRPRDAMAVLGKALRQGVAVFGEEDKRLVVGDHGRKVGVGRGGV